MKNKIKTSMDN